MQCIKGLIIDIEKMVEEVPVEHQKADVFRCFILESDIIWNHYGSVEG
jgi:hypothetical protein